MASSHDITGLLSLAREGDPEALNRLIPLVYDELRALAQQQRRRHPGQTLNTTGLVHEAYERLSRDGKSFVDRQHFFRVAARVMRGVLVDYARTRGRQKRGGGAVHLSLEEEHLVPSERVSEVLVLNDALTRLASRDSRQAEVVELRYFIGLTIPEAAEVLGLSEATVRRDWFTARAWLLQDLSPL